MSRSRLADIVAQPPEESLQWQAVVPIGTNPFIVMELFQMALIGALVGLVIMASGLWLIGGGLQPGDVALMLGAAGVFLAAVMGAFLAVGFFCFGNRYYALYHCTPNGIFFQGKRGKDESGERFCPRMRPYPVVGLVMGKKSHEKDLPWEKIDRFIDFPDMRSVQLKRGRWHMMRLYTPDDATHARITAYLTARLRKE